MVSNDYLARSSTLIHPSGHSFRTPLLIPSFSSKGFGQDDGGQLEIMKIFDVAKEYLTDSLLVSAYDLHYEYLEPFTNAITDLTVVDSGGYETSDFRDLSDRYGRSNEPRPWDLNMLSEIYNSWPDNIPAMFVSYDAPGIFATIPDQISMAEEFLSQYQHHMKVILLKPSTADQKKVQINDILANVTSLSVFDVIGITEKELAGSILGRMKVIATLRQALDREGLRQPIHIFGSLDPLTSVLYFLAGAEIFDGLTWLRFGYEAQAAEYIWNYGIRKLPINSLDSFVLMRTAEQNLMFLADQRLRMHRFLISYNFDVFEGNGALFAQHFQNLVQEITR